jgi:hypothetical protein
MTTTYIPSDNGYLYRRERQAKCQGNLPETTYFESKNARETSRTETKTVKHIKTGPTGSK